jgi:hypothetical protein
LDGEPLMPTTRNYLRSFAGGEISPEMFGRIDDIRYQTGAATVRNFIPKPQGPVQNRPGFELVREVKDSTKKTRLIPFTFSVSQTYVIELGAGYFRIHSAGGTLLNTGAESWFAEGETVPGQLDVTATGSGTLVLTSVPDHGLSNGDEITIEASGSTPTGISAGVVYYVRNKTDKTLNVSATPDGPLLTSSTAGSGVYVTRVYRKFVTVIFGGVAYYNTEPINTSLNYYASDDGTPDTSPKWSAMLGNVYEVPTNYAESELFDINYVQSNDVLTLVHPNHPPAEIRRYGALTWAWEDIVFAPPLPKPTNLSGAVFRGRRTRIERVEVRSQATLSPEPDLYRTTGSNRFQFNRGDPVRVDDLTYNAAPQADVIPSDFYQIREVANDGSYIRLNKVEDGGVRNVIPANIPGSTPTTYTTYDVLGYIQYSENTPDIVTKYKVTAVGDDDIAESEASAELSLSNNLFASGAYNTLSWNPVPGATRYNIYKEQNSLYGYIGQTEGVDPVSGNCTFTDDNIAPDMAISPPTYDDTITTAGNYPGAVAYFEQRRVFAGSDNEPQSILMTKSGTESDFSYQLPIRDDDRISFQLASREANRIRHVVPITELLLLTDAAEWRVTSVNSDAITPSTIAVRPQSYIGSSSVRPSVVNNSLVYCAARGGHVRELGYSDAVRGFVTNDVSLRAAHLFDNLTIVDQTYAKSPLPVVWFVSSNGKLLGLTYIPEQQIGAWHQHDTLNGTFESVCCVPEGDEDRLYVVVRRLNKTTGQYKRYVERMAVRNFDELSNAFFVDSGLTFDGTNTSATTMDVSTSTTFDPGEDLTLTSSANTFVAGDVGDVIELDAPDGTIYRLTITAYSSATQVTVQTDKAIPAPMQAPLTTWAFCRDTFAGVDHLEGYEVAVLADGAVQPRQTVSSGTVTLGRAFRKVHIGIPIQSDLKTLPMTLQIDGFGQGRHKNVNRVWLRVFRASSIFAGPNEDQLVQYKQRTSEPYGSPPELLSEQVEVLMSPSWNEDGQVLVRQDDPLPLTISGLTIQVALGG